MLNSPQKYNLLQKNCRDHFIVATADLSERMRLADNQFQQQKLAMFHLVRTIIHRVLIYPVKKSFLDESG
jgi:hypothetical protein